jgi:hypothetical protein
MSLLHPKSKNLRVGMNVRFRDNPCLVYKIIGRDRLTRTRFHLGGCKFKGEYRLTINNVHENELERA